MNSVKRSRINSVWFLPTLVCFWVVELLYSFMHNSTWSAEHLVVYTLVYGFLMLMNPSSKRQIFILAGLSALYVLALLSGIKSLLMGLLTAFQFIGLILDATAFGSLAVLAFIQFSNKARAYLLRLRLFPLLCTLSRVIVLLVEDVCLHRERLKTDSLFLASEICLLLFYGCLAMGLHALSARFYESAFARTELLKQDGQLSWGALYRQNSVWFIVAFAVFILRTVWQIAVTGDEKLPLAELIDVGIPLAVALFHDPAKRRGAWCFAIVSALFSISGAYMWMGVISSTVHILHAVFTLCLAASLWCLTAVSFISRPLPPLRFTATGCMGAAAIWYLAEGLLLAPSLSLLLECGFLLCIALGIYRLCQLYEIERDGI